MTNNTEWVTIPVAPNYEMDRHGRVRNKTTGRILKHVLAHGCKSVSLKVDTTRRTMFSISQLIWLTHGTVAKKTTITVPIIVSKGNQRHYFNTLRATAKFLADRENHPSSTVSDYLVKRRKEVYGWRINYQR